ncbi:MAG: UvrD-helicase domain-containing protein, partial [Alteromonadales bacterium]|nr:UvrD-helicase domain-containing protein [Alteromonadales bacterium]
MIHTIHRNFLGRWFGKVIKVVLSEAEITLVDLSKENKAIPIKDLIDFPLIERTAFGNTLILKTKHEVYRIWGISSYSARCFEHEVQVILNKSIVTNIAIQLGVFHKEAISQFLRDSSVDGLNNAVTPLIQSYKASKKRWKNILSKELLLKVDVISRVLAIADIESFRAYYENKQLDTQSAFFDAIELNPLTQEQRLAVIRNNDKNLILAAAGTGKTSVMVAKALHLIVHDKVPAEKVLVLAYNNAAAKELKERLESRKKAFGLSCQSPSIMTFHALGLKILNKVNANTALSTFTDNSKQLETWLSNWLITKISQSASAMQQFIELAYQPNDTFKLQSQEEHKAYISDLISKKPQDIITTLTASGLLEKNIKKFIKCLQAIRVEQLNAEQTESRLNTGKINNAKQYAVLLDEMTKAYVAELAHQGKIDFDDMIINAYKHISQGNYPPQWTDILVDEFQDISSVRMDLLNELINKGPKPRLTAVGDDWQSIYRFSGAKLELITQFEKFSGSHSLTTLQKTFRYNNSIADIAGQFVMQNPEQYSKHIESHLQVDKSQVYLVDSDKNNIDKRIKQIVSRIKANDPKASIAILARYRFLLNNASEELTSLADKSNIAYWTFHGAKGLEADYCIIAGFFKGKSGFPSENKEDAVVEALLPSVDGFKNSEERRLFYVALTRAKKKAYLIADTIAPSEFIEELLSPSYDVNIMSDKFEKTSSVAAKLCEKCGRVMKLKKGQYGDFWGCTGFSNQI